MNDANQANCANRAESSAGSVDENERLAAIARSLAPLEPVPDDVLNHAVTRDGACMQVITDAEPPGWLFDDGTDREVAARLCAGCPVKAQCLELELRLYGPDTVGVWGALGEDDRRTLFPLWLRTRENGSDR